jgi:hypothetical protein
VLERSPECVEDADRRREKQSQAQRPADEADSPKEIDEPLDDVASIVKSIILEACPHDVSMLDLDQVAERADEYG